MLYWWLSYGKFSPDTSGLYPQASQVMAQYREHAGWSREQLAAHLGLGEDAVYKAEHEGRGLDSVARRRQIGAALQIPPTLLGLCEKPSGVGWWQKDYEPWPAGLDGWPHPGAVIKWYRRAKGWTQVQCAEALGVQELTVRNMEKRNFKLDSISRRRAVGFVLGIPALLLGLDAEHLPSSSVSPATLLSSGPQLLSLEQAQTIQSRLWSGYYTGHLQEKVPQVRKLLTRIDDVLLQVPETQIPDWLEVQSLGYQWLGNVLRDHADPRMVLGYNKKAVDLARHTGNTDLLSIALTRQMESAYQLDQEEQAVKFAQVLAHIQEPDPVLSSGRALTTARTLALVVSDQADRSQVLRLVEQCQVFGNSYNINNTPEASIRRHAEVLLNLSASARDRARLLAEAADLLERLEPSEFNTRYQVAGLLTFARVALARKEYDQATMYALDAWPLMSDLHNWRKLSQFTEIYRALLQSSYASSPQVARLGLLLFEAGVL